jgi:hypothetical protein
MRGDTMPIPEILTVQSQPLLHVMQPFQGRHISKASSMPGSSPEPNSVRFKWLCVVLTHGSESQLRRLAADAPSPDNYGQGRLHDSKRQKLDRVVSESRGLRGAACSRWHMQRFRKTSTADCKSGIFFILSSPILSSVWVCTGSDHT